ncbi:fungal-specific transcription factor domain-containing protein [Aspergillus heterothallicus]
MFGHFQMPPIPNGDSSQSTTADRPNNHTRRACERCRQMKIKCDHAATCSNCRTSFNECVYTESRRKRKASPPVDRLLELEKRVKAMEESHRATSTARDIPRSLEPTSQQQYYPMPVVEAATSEPQHQPNPGPDEGEARFGWSSADRAFIDRLKDELGECPGVDFDSRLRLRDQPGLKLFQSVNLEPQAISPPPRERAEYLINIALNSTVLYHVIHRPTFDSAFELLYSLKPSDYGQEEFKYIPLVYALMALGCVSEKINDDLSGNFEDTTTERTRYFSACRDIVDLNDCSDIVTLQAIFYMNVLILNTQRLSLCYTSLTHALSLAIRSNLQQPNTRDNGITAQIKRRLFWTLRQLLVAVASMCGYPPPIDSNEIDIEQPDDIDDAELKPTRLSTSSHASATIRTMSASIGVLKLHQILSRIVQELYPFGGVRRKHNSALKNYLVSNRTVIELEHELQKWADTSLPLGLKLGQMQLVPHLEKAKYELWMTYFHVQIFLYRPFLHYFADNAEADGHPIHGFNKYASACVDASRNLIYLSEDMQRDRLFYGTHWRTAYMICTAGLSLIYAAISSKVPDTVKSIKTDLSRAKRVLECLIPYSSHGRRIYVALTVLMAAFVKSDHNSQDHGPSETPGISLANTGTTYTERPTEQASTNRPGCNPNHAGSDMMPEAVVSKSGSFLRVLETNPSQPIPAKTPGVNAGPRPTISDLATASPPTGYLNPLIQTSAPGTTMSIPVCLNSLSQSSEPVTDATLPIAYAQGPEFRLADQTSYFEARPFNLHRPTNGDEYQSGRDLGAFDDLTEDILDFRYLL